MARGMEREIINTCYFPRKTVEFFKMANNWVEDRSLENRCWNSCYLGYARGMTAAPFWLAVWSQLASACRTVKESLA
jgi:hypothetical protein